MVPLCSPVLVREPGSGFWEVGDHGSSWPAQVFRCDGKGETEAGTFHAAPELGVGRRLVH